MGIDRLNRIDKLPKEIFFVDWSLGAPERSFYFEVEGMNNKVVFCHISTFLSLFILKQRYFIRDIDGKFILLKV
jgi:hypothetical protein